ncbi:hypothetical protein D9M68_971410 [compost metagenome]
MMRGMVTRPGLRSFDCSVPYGVLNEALSFGSALKAPTEKLKRSSAGEGSARAVPGAAMKVKRTPAAASVPGAPRKRERCNSMKKSLERRLGPARVSRRLRAALPGTAPL